MSVVAVDLGGTKTTAALVVGEADVRLRSTVPTPASAGAEAVLATVTRLVGRVRDEAVAAGLGGPRSVGIGSAGVISTTTGAVVSATDAITGWAGTDLGRLVGEAVDLPVRVLNDVHAHALGEARAGAGRGQELVLVVAVGTGVGGAVVVRGRVLTGAHGAAGHLGHVPVPEADGVACPCGGVGHLEAVASGPGLVAAYHRSGGEPARRDLRAVAAAARRGDPRAASSLELGARALGRAVGGWVNALDPDVVVVTGGVASIGPGWWEHVSSEAARQLVPAVREVALVPAALGPDAALVGAAAHACETVAA